MNILIASLCALQAWLLPGCKISTPAPLQGAQHTIEIHGVDRSYRIFRPLSAKKAAEVPLLFVFHGGGGDAERAQEHFGFDKQAHKEGFMVVYPEGIDGHWNDGRRSEKFAAQDAKIDDIVYFRRVLAEVKAKHKVDASRIYAMGASNGGMFVQRLALEETETFAAVASTISSLPEPLKEGFAPKASLSVLFMSGTEDPIMPFEGGEVVFHLFGGKKKRRWEKSRGRVLPVREAAKLWIAHNGIEGAEEDSMMPDTDTTDDCQVRRRVWRDKTIASPTVVLYEIQGGGHTLPQLKSKTPKRFVGPTNGDINTQEVIWQFFADKKRTTPKEKEPAK